MTRELEIAVASCAYGSKGSSLDFEAGAKWADVHPKSPWISVEDRMPYFNKELLLEKFNCTKKFLTRDDENNFYIQRMWKSNGFWKWEYPANITHWFVIPKPPKE